MAPRVSVLIRVLGDRHEALCQTTGCIEGPDGGAWRSPAHVVKVAAEEDAKIHRQWHRRQQSVAVEPEVGA